MLMGWDDAVCELKLPAHGGQDLKALGPGPQTLRDRLRVYGRSLGLGSGAGS